MEEKKNLDEAIANTAEVKVRCAACDGNGSRFGPCEACDGYGFIILKLAATDIQRRLPKRKGFPVEYENLLE